MLKHIYGPDLRALAGSLIKELNSKPPADPLRPEIFVVQNHGVGQWLSLYMAEKEGVAANMKFEFPSERVWSLIRLVDNTLPDTLPSDRRPLTWAVMDLLGQEEVLSLPAFEVLRGYIKSGEEREQDRGDEDRGQQTVRRWKLSSKIADVFDQYLVYRPQMIMDWEQRDSGESSRTEDWQALLWNMLVDKWEKTHDPGQLHRARLLEKLLHHLREGRLDTKRLPDRVTVFGVSTLPPSFIDIMSALSDLTDVSFYQLCIDPEVESHTAFNNPLLQSLGKVSSRLTARISDCKPAERSRASVSGYGMPDQADTLLNRVQEDFMNDRLPGGKPPGKHRRDPSIQIHSCHSPMREVEVLYDQMLALLDANPDIHPDDILIMTPDLETYAPMVEAVFGKPDEGQPEIPYGIADTGLQADKPAVRVFLDVLDLCESRFKLTDVLDLLDTEPVQAVFGFSEEDYNRLERWIRDNRIRWGIDAGFKAQQGLPASSSFTWKSGIRNILLGYAMGREDVRLFHDMLPYDEIVTSDDADLAGRFSRFMHLLFEIRHSVEQPHNNGQWARLLLDTVNRFLPDGQKYLGEISQIRKTIQRLSSDSSLGGYSGEVPFSIIRLWLKEQLEKQSAGGGRIGRGVTFSSLIPMRSIPFKVIGIVGMNEGSFPRSQVPIEFDMMHIQPQAGDPKPSEEDRFLFLETVLSAGNHLYFSYVGQSNRQDKDFPPSVVLKEFMDYLEEYYGVDNKELLTSHRLQGFSPSYFGSGDMFTYSETQKKIASTLQKAEMDSGILVKEELPEAEERWRRITVGDLVSFFQHPAKYLLRNRLGIYMDEDDVLTEDREPFELKRLDKYTVEQELLKRYLEGNPLEPYQRVLHARNMLPEGWSGEEAFGEKVREAREFGNEIVGRLEQKQVSDREVNLEIGKFRITGTLSNIYERAKIGYRFGKTRPRDKTDWWIRHLFFQLSKPDDHSGLSYLFGWKGSKLEEFCLGQIESARAKELLECLLDLYWQGLKRPLPLYCQASYAYAEELKKNNKEMEKGIGSAEKAWNPSWNGYPGEGDDPYNKLVTGGKQPFRNTSFPEVSVTFWAPYFKNLKEGKA